MGHYDKLLEKEEDSSLLQKKDENAEHLRDVHLLMIKMRKAPQYIKDNLKHVENYLLANRL